jgi:hypothetical protein
VENAHTTEKFGMLAIESVVWRDLIKIKWYGPFTEIILFVGVKHGR